MYQHTVSGKSRTHTQHNLPACYNHINTYILREDEKKAPLFSGEPKTKWVWPRWGRYKLRAEVNCSFRPLLCVALSISSSSSLFLLPFVLARDSSAWVASELGVPSVLINRLALSAKLYGGKKKRAGRPPAHIFWAASPPPPLDSFLTAHNKSYVFFPLRKVIF